MTRVLLIRLGSLGDVIHAMPTAAGLRTAFPDARIDWATDPQYVPLVRLVEGVDGAIGVDTRAFGGRDGLVPGVRTLRRARYDAVLDLQGLLKSAVLARAAGGSRTIGFAREHLREPAARFFYTDAVDPGGATHIIRKNLALAAALDPVAGRWVPTAPFPLRVPPSEAIARFTERFAPDGFVLVNPGAAWPNKRWPPERFGALASRLRRTRGSTSVVLWGPGEEPRAEAVVAASDGAAVLAPPTTIPELLALASRARIMISGDTGPLHAASAVGTPVVALFGPTRAERNGPWCGDDGVISRFADCQCAYQRQCRLSAPCLGTIAVDEVVEAVLRRLDRRPA
ncbi:MAG: glycosyltransferase family 9 protein [Acidimicrobiia bacterium]|nr:glycosyltransferase family 9 protein [Acidimicrobiia bacterium]